MIYEFDFTFESAEKNILSKIKGKKISRLLADDVEKFAVRLLLISEKNNVQFSNAVTDCQDGDEYPKFHLEEGEVVSDYYTHEIDDIVNDIHIITDEVEWATKESTWRIRADIAIVIGFVGGSQLLIQLVDSLAGFMSYSISNDYREILSDINTQWTMKADKLQKSKRTSKSL